MQKLTTALCVMLLSGGLAAAQTKSSPTKKESPPARAAAGVGAASKQDAAERVLQKFLDAQGDAAAASVKSYVMRGIVDALEFGTHGTIEEYAKTPGKRLTVVNLPGGRGQILQGRDGRGRWAQTPYASVFELGKGDPGAMRREGEGGRRLRLRDRFSRLVFKGKTTLGGRELDVVEGTPVGGGPMVMYFDEQTGLLLRVDYVRRGEGVNELPKAMLFEGFAKVGGLIYPNVIREVFDDYTLLIRYYEVKLNVQIEDALFERPKGPDAGAEGSRR